MDASQRSLRDMVVSTSPDKARAMRIALGLELHPDKIPPDPTPQFEQGFEFEGLLRGQSVMVTVQDPHLRPNLLTHRQDVYYYLQLSNGRRSRPISETSLKRLVAS